MSRRADFFDLVLFPGALVGLLLLALLQATMEARTFRKLTGRTDVTWFDALWVSLRVDCDK